MLTHLPPLASYTPVYGNGSSVDSGNLNILSSLPEETRLYSLEHKQVMPKVQGLQCRKHSMRTPALRALFFEVFATVYVRDHADSARGGVTLFGKNIKSLKKEIEEDARK